MSWDTIELGEVIHIKHGYAFKSQFFSDSGKHILLTPGNCHETGGLKLKGEKEKYYTGDFPDEFMLKQGDLLVVMTDLINTAPILGGSFIIPEDDRFLHNQRLGLVQIKDKKKIDKAFLYYLLNTHEYRAQIRGSASGATVRHTAPERIYRAKLRVPSLLDIQRKIATILSAYDDLIENNLKRIALLEEAARQLYKEWFVRLRFPGHEHTRIADGVPEGWINIFLEEVVEVKNGYAFKSEEYSSEGVPLVRTRDFSYSRFINREDDVRIPENLLDKYKNFLLTPLNFLLIMVGASLGRFGIVLPKDLPILQNQNMWAIFTKDESRVPQVFVLGMMEETINAILSYRIGAAREFFRKDFVKKQETLIPPNTLLSSYKETALPIYEQINNLLVTNEKLKQARYLLLPRLMSGEIPV
jgi:type I restriction enzyme, S subunit